MSNQPKDPPSEKVSHEVKPLSTTSKLRGRLEQHKSNLERWESGFLDPTVRDELEKAEAIAGLKGAIHELELIMEMAHAT